jgi:hypothetical protein
MADNLPRKVVSEVVDYLVYAPVGLAATVVEELPGLVEKGRSRLTMAKTIGQFAVAMGRQQVEKMINDRQSARSAAKAPPAPPAEQPARRREAAEVTTLHTRGRPQHHESSDTDRIPSRPPGGAPAASPASLAIPGYDALAASQVVQRLAGLSEEELEAVREYEEATRGRRTILGRIEQLSSMRGSPEPE